jgi:hypothetical protein
MPCKKFGLFCPENSLSLCVSHVLAVTATLLALVLARPFATGATTKKPRPLEAALKVLVPCLPPSFFALLRRFAFSGDYTEKEESRMRVWPDYSCPNRIAPKTRLINVALLDIAHIPSFFLGKYVARLHPTETFIKKSHSFCRYPSAVGGRKPSFLQQIIRRPLMSLSEDHLNYVSSEQLIYRPATLLILQGVCRSPMLNGLHSAASAAAASSSAASVSASASSSLANGGSFIRHRGGGGGTGVHNGDGGG